MMVAVRFAVGGDVHELRMLAVVVKALHQAAQEFLAAVEKPFKGHLPRDDAIVKEERDRLARGELAEVGPRRIDAVRNLCPLVVADLPPAPGLARRQNGEANASGSVRLERPDIGGG